MPTSLEQRVIETIQGLISEISVSADLHRETLEWGGVRIDVQPKTAAAAPISVLVDHGGLTLSVGRLATREMYWCRHESKWDECLHDLAATCRAIITQGLEERVWSHEGRAVRSEATLSVEGRTVSFRTGGTGLARTTVRDIRYLPY